MDKKRITIITVAGALVLALVVFISLYFSSTRHSTPEVLLPDNIEIADGDSVSDDENYHANGEKVAVTRLNVQDVISRMSRPDNYYMAVTTETFFDGGSYIANGELWVSGQLSRVRVTQPNGDVKNIIFTPDSVYIWYDSTNEVLTLSPGEVTGDDELFLYTYEDVLGKSLATITDAGYGESDGISCIYAEVTDNDLKTKIWVSVSDALPVRIETTAGGEKTQVSVRMDMVLSDAGAEPFTLPDGTLVQG